jgi:hypothetical protein
MKVLLLLLFFTFSAFADESFYINRNDSGVELVCVGAKTLQCRVSQSANLVTIATKPIDPKEAKALLARFESELKPLKPGKRQRGSMRWSLSFKGYKRRAVVGSDRTSLITLLGIESELKRRLQ